MNATQGHGVRAAADSSSGPATALHDRLVEVVRPVVDGVGLDLENLLVQPAGRRRVVKVVVDRDGGVSADDLAEASREVSRVLDDTDAMGTGAYTLEVSSPGVDRPLTEPRHWRRALNRLVRVPLLDAGVEAGEARGRVVTADDTGVDLDADGEVTRYAYDRLGRGRIELEFRRTTDDAEDDADDGEDDGADAADDGDTADDDGHDGTGDGDEHGEEGAP